MWQFDEKSVSAIYDNDPKIKIFCVYMAGGLRVVRYLNIDTIIDLAVFTNFYDARDYIFEIVDKLNSENFNG